MQIEAGIQPGPAYVYINAGRPGHPLHNLDIIMAIMPGQEAVMEPQLRFLIITEPCIKNVGEKMRRKKKRDVSSYNIYKFNKLYIHDFIDYTFFTCLFAYLFICSPFYVLTD